MDFIPDMVYNADKCVLSTLIICKIKSNKIKEHIMKKSNAYLKIIALVMVIAMLACVLASCSSSPVMTLEVDGKTYTVTEGEFSTFMKVIKTNVLISIGYGSVIDSIIWDTKIDEDQTYDEYYTNYVSNLMKSVLIEKYLFDKFGLEYSEEKLAEYKSDVTSLNTRFGSPGSYKMYFGYTAQDYIDYYEKSLDRSELITEYLYTGENAHDPVTAEEKEAYYTDNYKGYMYIYLDMNNSVSTVEEEDGTKYYIGLDSSDNEYKLLITTEDGVTKIENVGRVDGKEMDENVTIVEFKTYELDDDGVDEKSNLPDLIMQGLEAGTDFKTLALTYSDDYYTYLYENGVFIKDTDNLVNNDVVMNAVRELEIDEHTDKLEISDGKYVYIVKRVDLIDKAYELDEYKNVFSSFDDDVMYDKYDELVDTYRDKIVADSAALSKFNMKNTFLSDYIDDYRSMINSQN